MARGTNRVRSLVPREEMTRGANDRPVRFEIEVALGDAVFEYRVALELPANFRELRVASESLHHNGEELFSREIAQVQMSRGQGQLGFTVDWHLVALPLIQARGDKDPLAMFRRWLAEMMILAPIPANISGDSQSPCLWPNRDVSNFGDWFTGLINHSMSSYGAIQDYLHQVIPDLQDLQNPLVGADEFRSMQVKFRRGQDELTLPFRALCDGEKCFFVCAAVLAANHSYGPRFCFWDEPDNYLAMSEIAHFVMALRRDFTGKGQLLMTSHNPYTVSEFSDSNILVLNRRSRLEPPLLTTVEDLRANGALRGELVDALTRGSLFPEKGPV